MHPAEGVAHQSFVGKYWRFACVWISFEMRSSIGFFKTCQLFDIRIRRVDADVREPEVRLAVETSTDLSGIEQLSGGDPQTDVL